MHSCKDSILTALPRWLEHCAGEADGDAGNELIHLVKKLTDQAYYDLNDEKTAREKKELLVFLHKLGEKYMNEYIISRSDLILELKKKEQINHKNQKKEKNREKAHQNDENYDNIKNIKNSRKINQEINTFRKHRIYQESDTSIDSDFEFGKKYIKTKVQKSRYKTNSISRNKAQKIGKKSEYIYNDIYANLAKPPPLLSYMRTYSQNTKINRASNSLYSVEKKEKNRINCELKNQENQLNYLPRNQDPYYSHKNTENDFLQKKEKKILQKNPKNNDPQNTQKPHFTSAHQLFGDTTEIHNDAKPVVEDIKDIYKKLLEGEITEELLKVITTMKHGASETHVKENDIAGLDDVKKLIRDKVINPILRPDLHYGLHEAPKGILLFGPPGTGKTMLAKWMSKESGATFFEVSPSVICSKWHGETESLIKGLFKVAQFHAPSVIFIDEVDSLMSKRTDQEQDQVTRMKNQFLQMMEGFSTKEHDMVVVVGATNRPYMLDQAALRRFSKRVFVPMPDHSGRCRQIRNLLQDQTTAGCALSNEEISCVAEKLDGWNGSDIKSLCSRAADYSYDDTINMYGGIQNVPDRTAFRPVLSNDLFQAMKSVHSSQDKADVSKLEIWCSMHGSK